jgi:hypothetical protein
MEADRAASGLAGVRFAYYCCACGVDDVFIDVFPVAGEAAGTLGRRLVAMKDAARRVRVDGVETRVSLLGPPAASPCRRRSDPATADATSLVAGRDTTSTG